MSKAGDNYAERNSELFAQRDALLEKQAQINELGSPRGSGLRRVQMDLERVKYEIVELNQGLVGDYVKQFVAHSPQLNDDLMSAGTTGLIAAINTYRLDKGASFAHWAYRMIQREVLTEVRKLDHPTLGQSDFENRPSILAAQQNLEVANPDQAPTEEEVASLVGVSVAQARRVMAPTRLLSLDKASDSGEGDSAAELVESIPNLDVSVESAVLDTLDGAALANIAQAVLSPRERFVVARRFGLDGEPSQTLAAVGAALNLSRESVRIVQANALQKLSSREVRDRLISEVGMAQDLANAY